MAWTNFYLSKNDWNSVVLDIICTLSEWVSAFRGYRNKAETANRHGQSGNSGRCAKLGFAMGMYSTKGSKDLNSIRLITR